MKARVVRREIDLAGRPTSTVVWLLRLLVRLAQIGFWVTVTIGALPFFWIVRRDRRAAIGSALAFLFQRLGATFIKIGQIMSSRPDVFSPELTGPLTALQDRVTPFRFEDLRRAIEEDFGRRLDEIFSEFEREP